MIDIFISYSSLDRKIAEEVCTYFEKEELSCWVSYRAKNLQPGKEYTDRISEAIGESKIFVVLLSENSVLSKQVLQEITLANDRQRFGMRIFPVIIDDGLSIDDIRSFAGYVLAGKENANWNMEESKKELLYQIAQCLGNNVTMQSGHIRATIPEDNKLIIGRDEELSYLKKTLESNEINRICLVGIGGIGKTALLQAFCNCERIEKYKTIVYMQIEKCILRTIANDDILFIEDAKLDEVKKTMSNYEYALYKLSVLENSVNEQTLIVLDNVEYTNDPLLYKICALNCYLIISTRYDNVKFFNFKKIFLEELKSTDSIHELFELYYGNKLETEEYVFLDNLLNDVHFHTMTIVLLAKQMNYFGKLPHEYKNEKQLRIERSKNLLQIMSESMKDSDIANIYMHLFELFDVSALTSEERKVMKTMCVLPSGGIYRHLYIKLLGDDMVQTVVKLEKIGWIQNNNERSIIMLHPLVRDVVMHELEIYIEDPDISCFIKNFIKLISNSWNASYQDNLKFKELALSIYFQFPKPTLMRYKEYLTLSKLLWILDCMDVGLEIQNKVKMLFFDEHGKRLNSAEEAEAFLQIGFTYQGKGDYINASLELAEAVKIYGNRYAAGLAHLAQAYMMIGNKSIDEVEPLLNESLCIRKKYWPGTISEAASCHLYAKTLSAYNIKLDFAMQLEKEAHRIFSKLQPEGVNVSSSAYILGWLYVQTAEDEDDIEFGIGKLEEAKRIRIAYRGDPMHSWMEDIYLKLGISYEKINNYQKAKDNYEMLLKIRINKYKDNPSQKEVIENYRLLERVYHILGDCDAEKKCKKYLKYYS